MIRREIRKTMEHKQKSVNYQIQAAANQQGTFFEKLIGSSDFQIDRGNRIDQRLSNHVHLTGMRLNIHIHDLQTTGVSKRYTKIYLIKSTNQRVPSTFWFNIPGNAGKAAFQTVANNVNKYNLLTREPVNTKEIQVIKSWEFQTYGSAYQNGPKNIVDAKTYARLKGRDLTWTLNANAANKEEIVPNYWLCYYVWDPTQTLANQQTLSDHFVTMDATLYYAE